MSLNIMVSYEQEGKLHEATKYFYDAAAAFMYAAGVGWAQP